MEDIYQYQLPEVADDARLFLWTVAAIPEEATSTMRAWGFRPAAELIWVKPTANGKLWFGMGRTVRGAHERCMIGVRCKPEVLSRSVRSDFAAKRGQRSEKPEEFYQIVEKLSPGPYLELFGLRLREGWTVLGYEVEAQSSFQGLNTRITYLGKTEYPGGVYSRWAEIQWNSPR
jgi:N6-adenosine-specific RNA methylase IME4